MSPRSRTATKPQETPVTTSTAPPIIQAGNPTDANKVTLTRAYDNRVKAEDVGLDPAGFETVENPDDVPAFVRNRGRKNPFDDPIRVSFSKKDADGNGPWVKARVTNLEAAEKQARTAATWLSDHEELNVGVEVRVQPDDDDKPNAEGVIWFRGKIKRKTVRNAK
jgi:hypothetical protein